MKKYPFIYLNRGTLDIEYIDKNEELFIWFKREVADDEKEKIMKNCPPPVDYVWHWGKEFVYFGSDGDTYDFKIAVTYSEDAKKSLEGLDPDELNEEDYDLDEAYASEDWDAYNKGLEEAIPLFQKDLESWINNVNETVPIAFFLGPHNPSSLDDWGKWSEKNVYDTAMEYLKKYRDDNPAVFKKSGEDLRYFGYIYNEITGYIESKDADDKRIDELLEDLEFAYDIDGMKESFERLEVNDHILQSNANKLYGLLEDFSVKKRVEKISRLKLYTQLAYYASYAADPRSPKNI